MKRRYLSAMIALLCEALVETAAEDRRAPSGKVADLPAMVEDDACLGGDAEVSRG